MNRDETIKVLEMLKVIDPMQSVSEMTGEAWHQILGRYPVRQVVEGAMSIAEQRRVLSGNRDASALDPYDVKVQVRRIRQDLLERAGSPCPNVDPDDVQAYRAEARALNAAIMDGRASPADAARYAGGGIRITAGDPFLPAGEVMRPFSLKQLAAAAGRHVDDAGGAGHGSETVPHPPRTDADSFRLAQDEAGRVRRLERPTGGDGR